MTDFVTGQGYYLAELVKNYHRLRTPYLQWAEATFSSKAAGIEVYQKSLLAWYEARILREDPYAGDVMDFLKAATAGYTNTLEAFKKEWASQGMASLGQDPVRYLPRAIRLNDRQRKIMAAFKGMDQDVKDLLLLSYYHQLSDHRLHKVLDIGNDAAAATTRRRVCLHLLQEDWKAMGFLNENYIASPEQQEIIDRYLRDELDVTQRWEVEARKTTDVLFRDTLQLREDWEKGLCLTARLDTLETLREEEKQYAPKPKIATSPKVSANSMNTFQGVLLLGLTIVLGYLLYTTFGPTTEKQLFAKYFQPFPNITKAKRQNQREDPLEKELAAMLIPYDKGQYLIAYDELLPAATAYPSAPMYLGTSALALNQPERAIDWFNHYLPGDRYHPYARWYIALSYLAQKRGELALDELSEIASVPGHPYEMLAIRVIEALE